MQHPRRKTDNLPIFKYRTVGFVTDGDVGRETPIKMGRTKMIPGLSNLALAPAVPGSY